MKSLLGSAVDRMAALSTAAGPKEGFDPRVVQKIHDHLVRRRVRMISVAGLAPADRLRGLQDEVEFLSLIGLPTLWWKL